MTDRTPPPTPQQTTAAGAPEISALRAELRRVQSALVRIDAGLSQFERTERSRSPRARPERYHQVLLAVYEHGRHGIDNTAFGELGATHGYDRRGLGGFFAGRRAPLRITGDRVVLTPEGERLLERYLQEQTS